MQSIVVFVLVSGAYWPGRRTFIAFCVVRRAGRASHTALPARLKSGTARLPADTKRKEGTTVAGATDHSSISQSLWTITLALKLLEEAGLNLQRFSQEVIDSPKFRKKVCALMRPQSPISFSKIPPDPSKRGAENLLRAMWDKRDETPLLEHENDTLLACCAERGVLRGLAIGLDETASTLLVMYYGLNGLTYSRDEVSSSLQLTKTGFARTHKEALKVVYANYLNRIAWRFYRHHISIDELRLSPSTTDYLKRGEVQTLGDLLKRSPNQLLAITHFTQENLTEVVDLLKSLGLELARD